MQEYKSPEVEIIRLYEKEIIGTSDTNPYDKDGDGFVDGWY